MVKLKYVFRFVFELEYEQSISPAETGPLWLTSNIDQYFITEVSSVSPTFFFRNILALEKKQKKKWWKKWNQDDYLELEANLYAKPFGGVGQKCLHQGEKEFKEFPASKLLSFRLPKVLYLLKKGYTKKNSSFRLPKVPLCVEKSLYLKVKLFFSAFWV